ncbi:MAG: lysozyme inhibitor LprI family protein, partial [Pseudomonadota bacterium]
MRLFLACALTLAPLAALAQDLVFSPQATELCLDSVAPIAQAQCVGHSADACMQDTVGGESTVGMGGCLWAEYEYWDARLNAA